MGMTILVPKGRESFEAFFNFAFHLKKQHQQRGLDLSNITMAIE